RDMINQGRFSKNRFVVWNRQLCARLVRGVVKQRTKFAVVRCVVLLLAMSISIASAATITVDTTADDLTPNDGSVSLREAITAINAGNNLGDPDIIAQSPGTFGTSDRINFNIPGGGVHTITHATDLPTIT